MGRALTTTSTIDLGEAVAVGGRLRLRGLLGGDCKTAVEDGCDWSMRGGGGRRIMARLDGGESCGGAELLLR